MVSRFPLVVERAETFAAAREFFRSASFDDVSLCRALRMDGMSDLNEVRWKELPRETFAPALNLCIDLFLLGARVPDARFQEIGGAPGCAALRALGLVRPAKHQAGEVVCPVWVYPADGCVVASDRRNDPDGEPFEPPEDVVFPAIYGGTLRFLELLPEAGGGDALDLCAGTGIGAFRLARTARSAVASDLTARSAQFAEFNARLNAVAVESLCGDLYAPVSGRRFDVITAHPPFVPSSGQIMVYRDGGETGEEVTRGVVAGLPDHLRPGGRCVILCVGRDAQDGPLEQRVRQWLGAARDQFDVVFGLEKTLGVDEVVETMRRRKENVSLEEAHAIHDRLVRLGTRQFVYGVLLIERFGNAVETKPLRLAMTDLAAARDFAPVLAWRRRRRAAGFFERLAGGRPRLVTGLELTARHAVREGADLVPTEFVFSREAPVSSTLRLDGWVVPLIARLNGEVTVADVYSAAKSQGETPANFPLEPFVELVASLVDRGFLDASDLA